MRYGTATPLIRGIGAQTANGRCFASSTRTCTLASGFVLVASAFTADVIQVATHLGEIQVGELHVEGEGAIRVGRHRVGPMACGAAGPAW